MSEYVVHDEVKDIDSLKVSADPSDIDPEERKKKVKKLAGAISHALRTRGEINVRAFGNAAIGKAAKALAIADGYINETHGLKLSYSPAFISTKVGENTLTGICFFTFAEKREEEIDMTKVKSVLMVKSDSKDLDPQTRKEGVKKLAGAITHAIEENKECLVRCFGNATIGKAAKALAIARGFVATKGPDLYAWNTFIMADIGGNERTGLVFYVYSNQ